MKTKKLTYQQLFDRTWMGLVSQGFRKCSRRRKKDETEDVPECLHSDGNGRHCALGWIRPDMFDPKDPSSNELVMKADDVRAVSFSSKRRQFLYDLQFTHDDSTSPKHMERSLRDLAKRYRLSIPIELGRRPA